jgi:HAD superfamily hydrolase (TIGR01549 family)
VFQSFCRDTITAANPKINPGPPDPASGEQRAARGLCRLTFVVCRLTFQPAGGLPLALSPTVHLKGMIFDVDGTLVDSNDLHAQAWMEAFEHFGKRFPYDVVRGQIGKGGDMLVPDLFQARDMRLIGEKVKEYRTGLFKEKYMPQVKPFPRIRQLFEALRAKGLKLALASSSNPDEVEYYTRLVSVGDLLSGSTSKHDAKHSKPSPEIFQAALDQIGTDPAFTMTVGDTPYDVLASHRVALPIAAVLSGGFERELLSKAEFLFDSVEEIVRKIDTIDEYFAENE